MLCSLCILLCAVCTLVCCVLLCKYSSYVSKSTQWTTYSTSMLKLDIRSKQCASFLCVALILQLKECVRMLLRHWKEGLTASSSLYLPILKNGSFILYALTELFNCITSTLVTVISAIPSFPCCIRSWLQWHSLQVYLEISIPCLSTCNMDHCSIFLERQHGVDAKGRITFATKKNPMRLINALSSIMEKFSQVRLCRGSFCRHLS